MDGLSAKRTTAYYGRSLGAAVKLFAVLLLLPSAGVVCAAEQYREPYRPQYHFTPKQGWIGDPDGLIRYRGLYHLFWWGHAVSPDLVHWKELPWPMKGDDGSFMYYTGSVVVDENNTGGWGTTNQPAMVAVYTAHERRGGREDQRLSISTDYVYFHYYEGNPVLNLNRRSFRDPEVFWHDDTDSWIMAITLPDDRKINFYSSTDLKSWRYMSSFGPTASQAPLWETPSLFQLPLDGNTNDMKWVLTCSLGPNKMQFFVGHFDGRSFEVDARDRAYLERGTGLPGDVWEDFEGTSVYRWTPSGKAFGKGPAHGDFPGGQKPTGYLGRKLGSSSTGLDRLTGALRSPAFTIERNCVNFLIGGGNHPRETCVNLVVSGRVVRTASGKNSEHMTWAGWDVSELKGSEAEMVLVDERTDEWGHIDIDHIMFSDVLYNTGREHANWIDWGQDFYAARIYRDYDHEMSETVWLGWMGNWDYANRLPMSWGQGAQSIPRELSLVTEEMGGYRLEQRPIPALRSLRGNEVNIEPRGLSGVEAIEEFRPSRNVYELVAVFELGDEDAEVGLNLCVDGPYRVALTYDAATSNVKLDRRASGDVSFSDRFPGVASAALPAGTERLTFHVFVDQSSIEVFVNDGEAVLTSQIFPGRRQTGIEVFSLGGEVTLAQFRAWELESIWDRIPDIDLPLRIDDELSTRDPRE